MTDTENKKTLESNVFDEEYTRNTAIKTLNEISKFLVKSYGPLAGTTIIQQHGDVPKITKDGFTILEAIRFDDIGMANFKKLITGISSNLVQRVGDGSTSSILAASNILSIMQNDSDSLESTFPIKRELSAVIDNIGSKLCKIISSDFTRSITNLSPVEKLSVLTRIATVSNNNDMAIGGKIANIMSRLTPESSISYKLGTGIENDIRFELKEGYTGIHSKIVHKGLLKDTATFNNALVFATYNFTDVHLKFIKSLVDFKNSHSNVKFGSIVVFADTYVSTALSELFQYAATKIQQGFNIIPMQTSMSTTDSFAEFSDMCQYTMSSPDMLNVVESFEPSLIEDDIESLTGFAKSIIINPDGGFTINGGLGCTSNSPQYRSLIDSLQKEIDGTDKSFTLERGTLRKRINRLNGMSCTIYIEGKTSEEKTSMQYLVEDSVEACRSVMNNGYTLGGNIIPVFALYKLIHDESVTDKEKLLAKLFLNAYIKIAEIHNQEFGYYNSAYGDYLNNLNNILQESDHGNANDNGLDIDPHLFNIITGEKQYLNSNNPTIIAPVATDIEIIRTTFSIITLIYNSNQIIL